MNLQNECGGPFYGDHSVMITVSDRHSCIVLEFVADAQNRTSSGLCLQVMRSSIVRAISGNITRSMRSS